MKPPWRCGNCDLEFAPSVESCLLCGLPKPIMHQVAHQCSSPPPIPQREPQQAPALNSSSSSGNVALSPPSFSSVPFVRSTYSSASILSPTRRSPSPTKPRTAMAVSDERFLVAHHSSSNPLGALPSSSLSRHIPGFPPPLPSVVEHDAELLASNLRRLSDRNVEVESELLACKRKLAASVARDADIDVHMTLANRTIADLRDRLHESMARVDVPKIVIDELYLRTYECLQMREDMFQMTQSVFADYQALLTTKSEERNLDSIATAAAVSKNATVIALRDQMADLELQLRTAETIAKEKSKALGEAQQTITELRSQNAMAEVMWRAKENQLLAQQTRLELEIATLKGSRNSNAGSSATSS